MGLRSELSERNSPNTSAEDTNHSGSSVFFHALTVKLSRNSFFSLRRSIQSSLKVRLLGSWYLFPMKGVLWCCVPNVCNSTLCITQISTKASLNCEPSSKTSVFVNPVYTALH